MKQRTFSERGLPQITPSAVPRSECQDCHRLRDDYHVYNAVWNEAFQLPPPPEARKPRGHLCFECLEERLGRKLTLEDFSLLPINRGILLGAKMQAESQDERPTEGDTLQRNHILAYLQILHRQVAQRMRGRPDNDYDRGAERYVRWILEDIRSLDFAKQVRRAPVKWALRDLERKA